MSAIDLWDDAGPFQYRHLPEGGLEAFFTEERDMLQVSRDADGWWLEETRVQGATRYDTEAEAKAAGDEIVDRAEAEMDGRMLAEAGLDATRWKVSYDDGIRFETDDPDLMIVADVDGMSARQSWSLYRGDDELVRNARDVSTAVAAASALLRERERATTAS